jgi:hypothetical protein
MPYLVVNKEDGTLLFDTRNITHGLLKSGYMELNRTDGYYSIRGINVDPDQKSSYNYYTGKYPLHGFTVQSASCPIAFLVGPGSLVGTSRSGDTITFYYVGASTSTKYYCFDLMRDTSSSGPFLKAWLDTGVCTFNSLMIPLNIHAAVTAPGPGETWPNGMYKTAYAGGSLYQIANSSGGLNANGGSAPNRGNVVNVALGSGEEYAAHLPWSRSIRIIESGQYGGGTYAYNGVEGAYGRVGGISFMFSATSEGTITQYTGSPIYSDGMFTNLPIDRFPIALVVRTSNLPFPYSAT